MYKIIYITFVTQPKSSTLTNCKLLIVISRYELISVIFKLTVLKSCRRKQALSFTAIKSLQSYPNFKKKPSRGCGQFQNSENEVTILLTVRSLGTVGRKLELQLAAGHHEPGYGLFGKPSPSPVQLSHYDYSSIV